jgi:hypothetical protein
MNSCAEYIAGQLAAEIDALFMLRQSAYDEPVWFLRFCCDGIRTQLIEVRGLSVRDRTLSWIECPVGLLAFIESLSLLGL